MKKQFSVFLLAALMLVLAMLPAQTVVYADNTAATPEPTVAALPEATEQPSVPGNSLTADVVPEYEGVPFLQFNGGYPEFEVSDFSVTSYLKLSPLDQFGRTGAAMACIGRDLLATDTRNPYSADVTPSGWQSIQYPDIIAENNGYLYNRCHLVGYQLCGMEYNQLNLITGTRWLNISGMLPYENAVHDYVTQTGNHVLYRVTPIYAEDDLVARGITMEAFSVEDLGEGICFSVFIYNVQPGITIDYSDGSSKADKSWKSGTEMPEAPALISPMAAVLHPKAGSADADTETGGEQTVTYVLNTHSMKIHLPDCSSVADISPKNRLDFYDSLEAAEAMGYTPCGVCNPG